MEIIQRILNDLGNPSVHDNCSVINFHNNVYLVPILSAIDMHFAHLPISEFSGGETVLSCLEVKTKPFSASLEVLTSMWNSLMPVVWMFKTLANSFSESR